MTTISNDLWRKISEVLRSSEDLDEENTKRKIIDPLLLEFGWDLFGDNVSKAFKLQVGSKVEEVDYALLVDNSPKVFLEAKRLSSKLTDSNAKQVLSYGRIGGVRWCVLSNGRIFKIFNSDWGTEPEDALFRSFELNPSSSPPDDISLLSRDLIRGGELDRKARDSQFDMRVRAVLSEILDELRQEVMKSARNKIFSRVKQDVPGATRQRIAKTVEPILQIRLAEEEAEPDIEPLTPASRITTVSRSGIDLPDDLVIICPGRPAGAEWMKNHNAWGYVRVGREPKYFALYVSRPVMSIEYFAQVDKIIDPSDPDSPSRDRFRNDPDYRPGKKVIVLKRGSLVKLDPGIPLGELDKAAIQGLRYCKLDTLRKAMTVDDLW